MSQDHTCIQRLERVIGIEVGAMGVVAACHDQASSLRARVHVRLPTVTAVMPSASAWATAQEPAAQVCWASRPVAWISLAWTVAGTPISAVSCAAILAAGVLTLSLIHI